MITMNWEKDAAGRLTAQWQGGEETARNKATCRYHKAVQTEFKRRSAAGPRLRKARAA